MGCGCPLVELCYRRHSSQSFQLCRSTAASPDCGESDQVTGSIPAILHLPVYLLLTSSPQTRKRRRTKPIRFEFDSLENDEQRLLQQALQNSRKDMKREQISIPEAPVFYPTLEEFKDPMQYIQKIRQQGSQFGLCKIIPPDEWRPPNLIDMNDIRTFPTRIQEVNTLQ
eukprot:gene10702-22343_t